MVAAARRQSARLVPVLAGYQVPSNRVTIIFAISVAPTSEHAVETSLSRFLLSIRRRRTTVYKRRLCIEAVLSD